MVPITQSGRIVFDGHSLRASPRGEHGSEVEVVRIGCHRLDQMAAIVPPASAAHQTTGSESASHLRPSGVLEY